jgi:hypothetical protein
MSLIIISGGSTSVTTADASDSYIVESSGTLEILGGGLVSGLITLSNGGQVIVNGGTALREKPVSRPVRQAE